jgi:peroxygenase
MQIQPNQPILPIAAPTPKPVRTAIQKHADYFDKNHDGKVSLGEAYEQMRALGVGKLGAALGAVAGNAFLAHATGSCLRHPFTILTDKIAAGKHPGDTGNFNADGTFNQANFDTMFATRDLNKDGSLSQSEVKSMIAADSHGSKLGSVLSTVEFGLLMTTAGQPGPDGAKVLTRERLEQFYDGTLLYALSGQPVPS